MEITSQFIALVPFVLGVVQAAKIAGLNARYAPILSIALGMALGIGVGDFNFEGIVQGIAIGLAASGLWSGVRTLATKENYI